MEKLTHQIFIVYIEKLLITLIFNELICILVPITNVQHFTKYDGVVNRLWSKIDKN